MNFTKQQMQAIWFIVFIIGISTGYKLFQYYFREPRIYDFSKIDERFLAKRDSILAAENLQDSLIQVTHELKNDGQKIWININTAGSSELTKLPRIGPKIAQRIIEYRNKNGPFRKTEELMKVKGIGKKTFENLQSNIYINHR